MDSECCPVRDGSVCGETQPVTQCVWAFAFLSYRWRGLQGLKLGFNRCDIGVDQVIEQAGLLRIHLLAALGKLQTLELCDLVGQLLYHRLIAVNFLSMVWTCDSNCAANARSWLGVI